MRRSRSSGTIPVSAVLAAQPRQRGSLRMQQSDYAGVRGSHGQPLLPNNASMLPNNNPLNGAPFALPPAPMSIVTHNGTASNYTPPASMHNASSCGTPASHVETPGSTVRVRTPSRCALYSTPVAVHDMNTHGTMFNSTKGSYALLPSASIPFIPSSGDANLRSPLTANVPPLASECFRQHPIRPPRIPNVYNPAGAYLSHGNSNGLKGMMSFGSPVNPIMLGTTHTGMGPAHLWRTPVTPTVESTASERPSRKTSEPYDSESGRENGRRVIDPGRENGHRKSDSGRSDLRSERDSGRGNGNGNGYHYAEDTFVVDISCLGERNLKNDINGFIKTRLNEDSDENAFVKLGSRNDAMLISAKGYANGQHYWELQDCIEIDDDSEPQIRFCVGLVPRSIRQAVDIDMTIANNSGFSLGLTHGLGKTEFQYGDRIGVHLDCTGHMAVMRFFKNGQFSATGCGLSLKNIPKDKPLYPALCMMGHASAHCAFSVVPSPTMPNIAEHEEREADYIAIMEHEVRRTKLCTLRRPQYSDKRKRDISLAHRGATVEISSALNNELAIRQGDAILFVDKHVDEECEWHFDVSDDEILAQDTFYLHQEFDLHSPTACTVVKVAYKFIALSPGIVEFRSSYAPMQGIPQWRQAVRIVINKVVN
eukprot:GEMP01015349.1.p1 GENE.GEMP01015349.1~~GEMP01015349.1.p1  ORF type:complete len:651 (+),score=117.53 GEMP01015349.1:183-2135(+)